MENIFNYKLLDNVSIASNVISDSVDLSLADGYAIQAYWSGTAVGSLKLQVSNDNVNWTDYAGSTVAVTSGPGNAIWLEADAMYDKVRVVYTSTSGTGNLTVQINGKGDTQ